MLTLPLAGGDELPETRREGKMFFVIEKLFDKLPDIMGPILLPLDQENKNPNGVNATLANRHGVKI